MSEKIVCELSGCTELPYAHVRWGGVEQQAAKLCRTHVFQLWETVHTQIATGLCFWVQTPLEESANAKDA